MKKIEKKHITTMSSYRCEAKNILGSASEQPASTATALLEARASLRHPKSEEKTRGHWRSKGMANLGRKKGLKFYIFDFFKKNYFSEGQILGLKINF